jgi:hypothetical protein
MCSTGLTETGPTEDFGGHNLDESRMPSIVEDARSPLLKVTGGFASKVVVLDLRIKKVFVKHIVEASSVDGDGLVNNGGISDFHGLLSLIGNETIRLAHAYVDSGLLYVRSTVLPKPSENGRTGEAATDSMRI